MKDWQNILFIGAHPDDIEIGCGGFIEKMIKTGHRARFIVLSKGENGGDDTIRQTEQDNIYNHLKVPEYDHICLEYPDGDIQINGSIFDKLEQKITGGLYLNLNNSFYPDVVFVHYPKDTHQDHRSVSEMVRSICFRKNIDLVFYDSYSSYNFEPNMYVGIDWTEKLNILSQFQSQISRCPEIITRCLAKSVMNGCRCNELYAESFRIEKINL